MKPVLDASHLSRRFGRGCERCFAATGTDAETNICPFCGSIVALNDVSLRLYQGEILAIMGESGSGKSTLLRALHLEDAPSRGQVTLYEDDLAMELLTLQPHAARSLRNRVFGMVYQNARIGLNFRVSAGGNIAERLLMSGARHYSTMRARAIELFEQTHVPVPRIDANPETFSGGMQQRLQIARALAASPAVLLLDEVTTGLDLSVQARILDLILELHQTLGLSILAVTHDIGVARLLASQTIIMKHGCIVEQGLTDQILEDPQHPYTQELISAAL